MFELQCRPIDKWPGQSTKARKRSQFSATYGDTMNLVAAELGHLKAKAVVLLMALKAEDIRNDGRPRANARPSHPGVILAFDTPRGQMRFPCDRFDLWEDNLRAIALSLEALRKVDRYGVTKRAEQYTAWQALPPPNGDHWNREQAAEFIGKLLDGYDGHSADKLTEWALVGNEYTANMVRLAEFKTHPDRGGNADDFKKVQRAKELLLA
jgi:hypothetical protein